MLTRYVVVDLDQLISVMAHKMAEREGILLQSPVTPSEEAWNLWHKRAIFALQVISDEDWLRFTAPGTTISSPGF